MTQQQQQQQQQKQRRLLITGATGNVGREVILALIEQQQKQQQQQQQPSSSSPSTSSSSSPPPPPVEEVDIVAAVRNVDMARSKFPDFSPHRLSFCRFDFEDSTTFLEAFQGVDAIFLVRPPPISDVDRVFRPLLEAARDAGISKIVFLSVQGAERSSKIPHNRIERLIVEEIKFPSAVMVRPSYFMQNLTTTFLTDLQGGKLVLPSGNALFNWIDVRDIGKVVSVLLLLRHDGDGDDDDDGAHKVLEITGSENKSFPQAIDILNRVCGTSVEYRSINPVRFFFYVRRKKRLSNEFAFVITLLHSLPRWQKNPPAISSSYQELTGGESPTTLEAFFQRERELILGGKGDRLRG
eukprot:CAMPEP_0113457220 /NCGR_PEP_ID=MMETSP0014_2-20120614/9294_1 /TAXON_ID=2857 /ORGANISM="Nitzschia sp." /LENGTH=352 /DNA_ID=CAMNT_0000348705 /DNA_START=3795 /DNA_END=4853 /DNA_ORIENTATION=+ /assembly_acc=CAM_ASM_000159